MLWNKVHFILLGINRAAIEYNASMNCRPPRRQHLYTLPRIVRLLWCSMLMLGMLTGCATGSNPDTGSSSPAPQPEPQNITLTIWHSWNGSAQDALNALVRAYEQANPNIRIRLEAHPAATLLRDFGSRIADESAPQIIIMPGRYIGELAERQYLAPLDETAFTLDDLIPATVDAGRARGQLYGVPLTFDALVLFYDRRVFATPPETFQQIAETELTSPISDTVQWKLGYYLSLERTLPYLPAFNGSLFDANDQPIFASESRDGTIQWLDWLRSLHTNPAIRATTDFSMLDAEIQQGSVLSAIDWSYKRADYEQIWGADAVGIAPLPRVQAGQPHTMVLAETACINAVTSSEQRTAAEHFLRFSIDPTSQALLVEQSRNTVLPSHSNVTLAEQAEATRQAIQPAQAFNSQLTTPRVWQPLDDMVRSVVSNAANSAEAVDIAGAAVQP